MVTKKQYYARFKSSYDEQVNILRDMPVGQIKSHIEPKLYELHNDFEGNEILAKILIIGEIDKSFLEMLSNGFGCPSLAEDLVTLTDSLTSIPVSFQLENNTVQAAFYTEKSCKFNYEGLFEGQLGIVFFTPKATISSENLALIKEMFSYHAWVWILKDSHIKTPHFSLRDDALACEWFNYDEVSAFLPAAIKRPDFSSKLAVCQTYNAFLVLENLQLFTSKFVKQAERNSRVQRLSMPTGPTNTPSKTSWENDPYYQIKNNTQQQLVLLEKRVQDAMERFFLPATGDYWNKVYPSIDTLKELETITKAKSNILKINDKVQDAFLNLNRKVLHQQYKNIMRLVNDAVNSLEKEIGQNCREKEIPIVNFFNNPLSDKELPLILDSSVRMERPYEATVQRKGFYEYFMAVRKYQMLFLMLVSLFGIGSFIRSKPQITITASLILTGFGAYTLRKTVRQERQEQMDKEVYRAQENLREEAKRIGNETLQRWIAERRINQV